MASLASYLSISVTKPFPVRTRRRRVGIAGFSLVESMLALGIIAVGFTSICGVLPLAYSSYRGAMDATCRANIVARVSSEIAQAPFDQIVGKTAYYGDQGVELSSGPGPEARYKVTYEPADEAALPGTTTSSLRPVTIKIFPWYGTSGAPAGEPKELSKVTIFVADNGIRAN